MHAPMVSKQLLYDDANIWILALEGMEVHLTFDETRPLDSSGKKNHGSGEVMAAAGIGSAGSSALFRNNYIYIPSSDSFKSADFSYTFFVYLLEDAKSRLELIL